LVSLLKAFGYVRDPELKAYDHFSFFSAAFISLPDNIYVLVKIGEKIGLYWASTQVQFLEFYQRLCTEEMLTFSRRWAFKFLLL
jgi:hypothetical protein